MEEAPKRRGRPPKKQPMEEPVEEIQVEEIVAEPTQPAPQPQAEDNQTFTGEAPAFGTEGTQGNWNPYGENVVQRDYATPQTAEGIIDDIPEPDFTPPSFEDMMNTQAQQEQEEMGNPFDNPNPALNDLPPQEKQVACEQMVDTFLGMYESLHTVAINFAKVSEDKVQEMGIKGDLDPSERIPVDEQGNTMTVMDFVKSYNDQTEEALGYDREFNLKVRPAMVRIFMKKGWGLTDEQFVLLAFGQDLATKGAMFYGLKKSINGTLDLIKKQHKRSKGGIPTQEREDDYDDSYEQMEDYEQEEFEFEQQPMNEPVREVKPTDVKTEKQKFTVPDPQPPKVEPLPKEVQDDLNKGE